jgi:hypothetical protein
LALGGLAGVLIGLAAGHQGGALHRLMAGAIDTCLGFPSTPSARFWSSPASSPAASSCGSRHVLNRGPAAVRSPADRMLSS